MRWFLAVIIWIWPLVAMAEGLPQAVVVQVERNPEKYLDDLAVLIAGYGNGGTIDAVALHNVVALARAQARAVALNRLLGADLNGDGAVSGAELRVSAAALAASARGRLVVNFGKADVDGDGAVTAAELQFYANTAAQKAFSEAKAAAVYAIMGFDGNGDGQVTLPEVAAAIAQVASAATDKKIKNQLQIKGYDDHGNQDGQGNQPARRREGTHLFPVSSEHDQGDHGEAELQA